MSETFMTPGRPPTAAGASTGLTNTELRATPVPVSLSQDIEIGAVEIKNGADDTRAVVTAAGAVKVDGSAVTQPISAATLPLPTGAALEAGNLATIAGKDFSTQTTLAAVLAKILTAPATEAKQDTGNTSLATIAAKDFSTAAKQDTLLAELQLKADLTETQPVKELRAATFAQATVADTATSTTILASNAARLGATIENDSSAVLYLLLGTGTASATNYSARMVQYAYYEVPYGFTGALTGVWATDPGDGAARVTELTA